MDKSTTIESVLLINNWESNLEVQQSDRNSEL
jgi:hypothetical protein